MVLLGNIQEIVLVGKQWVNSPGLTMCTANNPGGEHWVLNLGGEQWVLNPGGKKWVNSSDGKHGQWS